MFIYQTSPLDDFTGMINIADAVKNENIDNDSICSFIKIAMKCAAIAATSKNSYWEYDIRGNHLYIFSLPDPDNCCTRIGLVWKQDNNGTTYICSPVKLPWISENDLIYYS